MLIWQRVSTTGMVSGEYRVGKYFLDGCTLYRVYFGIGLLKTCNDFAECKEVAEAHLAGEFNEAGR